MGRINFNDLQHYKTSSDSMVPYFSLKNHKDTAKVRVLANTIEDLRPCVVHEISMEFNGKKYTKYVNCLREYSDPYDMCPFCANGNKQLIKFFIPVYDERDGKTKVWIRHKSFEEKLSSFMSRYAREGSIAGLPIEIERNGQPGDTKTAYELYPMGQNDGKTVRDFPDAPKIIGGAIYDKNADELRAYLSTGSFDTTASNNTAPFNEDFPRRRTPNNDESVY